jgi:hypothetical protein
VQELTEFPDFIVPRRAQDIITPIDHDVALRLVVLLLDHGAQVRQLDIFTYTARLPDGRKQSRLSSHHHIQFPPGTLLYDGLMLAHSRRFRLVFPDGFELYGRRIWLAGDMKTILYIQRQRDAGAAAPLV